jgi:hypothetical protein
MVASELGQKRRQLLLYPGEDSDEESSDEESDDDEDDASLPFA